MPKDAGTARVDFTNDHISGGDGNDTVNIDIHIQAGFPANSGAVPVANLSDSEFDSRLPNPSTTTLGADQFYYPAAGQGANPGSAIVDFSGTTIDLGAGDDHLTISVSESVGNQVPVQFNATGAVFDGGAGNNTLQFNGLSSGIEATLKNFENITGTAGNDTFLLSGGNETVTGNGGADTYVFSAPTDPAYTITDFTSGVDTLQVSTAAFGNGLVAGQAPTLLVGDHNAVANVGADSDFIFDNSDPNGGTLYWDANGGNGADATAVAVVHGVNALLPTDFHVV